MEVIELKYHRYHAYRNSGVKWIGEIPKNWTLKRIKFLFKEINERSFDGSEELLSVSQYTGITKKLDKVEEGDLLTNASTLEGYKKVYKGDLVSNIMLAWNGSLGFSQFNGITSPAYSVYRLKFHGNEQFFHYLFRTELYKSEFKRNSSGVIESRLRLYTDDFFNIWALLPSEEEQTAIANFLDNKTAKIAQAIAQKEKMIELLKERKQIIIQNAVTKGLDPNAKMKRLNNQFISELPITFKLARLKHVVKKISDGPHFSPNYVDNGVLFLSAGNIRPECFLMENAKQISEKDYNEFSKRVVPEKGDVLYTKGGTTGVAKVVDIDEQFQVWVHIAVLKLRKDRINPTYLAHSLNSNACFLQSQLYTRGATNKDLGLTRMVDIVIPLPSLVEQKQIVEHIETQSTKIDKAITLQQTQIEKLKEYKATLIDSAVTGKIKVS